MNSLETMIKNTTFRLEERATLSEQPNRRWSKTEDKIANSAQTEYCPTFLCMLVSHRRDISGFLDNLTV